VAEAGWIAEALRFAVPALALPGPQGTAGAALGEAARLLEVDDPAVLLSACEPLADAGVRVRLWNASGRARAARVRLAAPGAGSLRPVDLCDEPDPRALARPEGEALILQLRPWQVATLLARPGA
jgi:hypothetical protein